MKLGKIIINREKSKISCYFRQNQANSIGNREKNTFCFFWWNWEKSSEIVRKASFHANSDKIRQILLEIGRKLLFAFLMKPGKIIKNHEKGMFSCWFNQNQAYSTGNREKITFCFFWWNGEKSSKIVRKACFHADLNKIRTILLEIGRNILFAFFDETGKNYQKTWEKQVFMLLQTKSGKFYWKSGKNAFLLFWWNWEKLS